MGIQVHKVKKVEDTTESINSPAFSNNSGLETPIKRMKRIRSRIVIDESEE